MTLSVTVTTQIPSPYQAELFDAVAATGRIRLQVIYFLKRHASRHWEDASLGHDHLFIDVGGDAARRAHHWVRDADLCVFSYYGDRFARQLLRTRGRSGRAWCLWGERPGAGWGRLGRLRRRFHLAELARSEVPIWGIGRWAVEGWRGEFDDRRPYENVPYFSDITRFRCDRTDDRSQNRTILFSGSLIQRKGVDLLAEAFLSVAREVPGLRLDVIGCGELQNDLKRVFDPVGDRVRLLGFQQWDRLPEYYHAADILCAPSRYDGWGLIVPEGLAAGLPVIGTNQTGAALDLITPGENGWLVEAGNLGALRTALREAATMPVERLREMSRAALETAAGHSLAAGAGRFCAAAEASLARFTALRTISGNTSPVSAG